MNQLWLGLAKKRGVLKTWNSFLIVVTAVFFSFAASAQDVPIDREKFILFPHPQTADTRIAIGFNGTVIPNEITEELHYRIPAAELRLVKKLSHHFSAEGAALLQVLQNMIMAGPRWSNKLSDRLSFAAGDNLGFWFGRIKIANVNTQGHGFQNYPYLAFGYRFNKRILASLKAESIMNFGVRTRAGNTEVQSDYRLFSGSAYTLALEQPFAGNKSVVLGFKAIYTDYFWQTWTLFENYNRNLFFPQVIVLLIL